MEEIQFMIGDKVNILRNGFEGEVFEIWITRQTVIYNVKFAGDKIGTFDTQLVEEFLRRLAATAGMNLHAAVPHGTNDHHIAEAIFKAVAQALRAAKEIDPARKGDIPSTKGTL